MKNTKQIVIPDIGTSKKVCVIEILVTEGSFLNENDSIIVLESEKSSIEIPSNMSGIVKNIFVKVGDMVSTGSIIAELETSSNINNNTPSEKISSNINDNIPSEKISSNINDNIHSKEFDVLVLGGGPGGYSAAFRAADLGLKTAIVEKYSTLGGVCLNVGCIPSKTLLYNTHMIEIAKSLSKNGIFFDEPQINLQKLKDHKDQIINKLTNGLLGLAKLRNVKIFQGIGEFIDKNTLSVTNKDNIINIIKFKNAIIATGSSANELSFLPKHDRILNSTMALNLPFIPKKMLLIGGGIISLEMGTVYSSLGAKLDLVESTNSILRGVDKDLVQSWKTMNIHRFDNIMLDTKIEKVDIDDQGINVQFTGINAPSQVIKYDLILQAIGRSPNVTNIGLQNLNLNLSKEGFIKVDNQYRTNISNIFAIGDVIGHPMLAHKAVHEGHIAAEVISGKNSFCNTDLIPSVAYTNPEIAWVGVTEEEAKKNNLSVKLGIFPWNASGRAISNDCHNGITKLIFDPQSNRILGGGIVGTHAGDLIGEIALAIEMGSDIDDIANTIHPHPTFIESIAMAAESAEGICTDLPPILKKI